MLTALESNSSLVACDDDSTRPQARPPSIKGVTLPEMAKMILPPDDSRPLMTSGEVAELFNVDGKTVTRWAKLRRFGSYRTPGNHRRYDRDEVYEFLNGTRE